MIKKNEFRGKKSKIFYGHIIVTCTLVISASMWGTLLSFGVFIEPMLAEFGWGSALLSGAFSTALLLGGFFGIFTGKLSDRFGPKKVVLVCNIFFGLGYVLMSQVNSIWQLYLFFGLIIGIGISAGIAPLMSTVVKWFIKRRGLMVAVFLMGLTIGQIIGPPVANLLIQLHGWRTAFVILGTVSFSVILLSALFLKSDPTQIGQRPYGANNAEVDGEIPEYGFLFKQAFRTKQFWLLCAFFSCFGFVFMVTSIHIIPHAINVGISPSTSALILSTIGISATVMAIPEGFLADRIGVKKTAIIIIAIMTMSFLWLLINGISTWSFFMFAIMFGLVTAGMDILLTLLTSDLFGLIALGTIIGFVNFALELGTSVGPVISGLIFDSTGSYYLAFMVCIILSVITLILLLLLREIPARK